MNAATWVAIYMPVFMLFFVIIPQQRAMQRAVIQRIKKRKGVSIMANELLKKYVGKYCTLTTGSYGTAVTGKIIEVNENWVEVETKKGPELINAEFVQSVRIKF